MIMASARRRLFVARSKAGLALFLLSGPMALVLGATVARADVIVLRGGGQVTGKVVPDPQSKDRVLVWLLQGRQTAFLSEGANHRGDSQGEPAR